MRGLTRGFSMKRFILVLAIVITLALAVISVASARGAIVWEDTLGLRTEFLGLPFEYLESDHARIVVTPSGKLRGSFHWTMPYPAGEPQRLLDEGDTCRNIAHFHAELPMPLSAVGYWTISPDEMKIVLTCRGEM